MDSRNIKDCIALNVSSDSSGAWYIMGSFPWIGSGEVKIRDGGAYGENVPKMYGFTWRACSRMVLHCGTTMHDVRIDMPWRWEITEAHGVGEHETIEFSVSDPSERTVYAKISEMKISKARHMLRKFSWAWHTYMWCYASFYADRECTEAVGIGPDHLSWDGGTHKVAIRISEHATAMSAFIKYLRTMPFVRVIK